MLRRGHGMVLGAVIAARSPTQTRSGEVAHLRSPQGLAPGTRGVLCSSHHFVLPLPSERVTDPAEESPAMSCSLQGQAGSRHPTTQLQRGWEPGAELKWAPGPRMGVPGGAGRGCGCSGEGSAPPAQL